MEPVVTQTMRYGWIGVPEVAALCVAIQQSIKDTGANAQAAQSACETMHLETRVGLGDDAAAELLSACDARFATLAADIDRSATTKTIALETEAVAADAILERLHGAPAADIKAMQAELHSTFGDVPLAPAEPSALSINADSILCAPRRVDPSTVSVSILLPKWIAPGLVARIPFVLLMSGSPAPGCAAELRATLLSLTPRLRASAVLLPSGDATAATLSLDSAFEVNAAGDGVFLTVIVPDLQPFGPPSDFVLRITRLELRGTNLALGALAQDICVLRSHVHSSLCNHVKGHAEGVYAAATCGDVAGLDAALLNGASTEETNGVREQLLTCSLAHKRPPPPSPLTHARTHSSTLSCITDTQGGMTALMIAACYGHLDVVRKLVEAGADVTATMTVRRACRLACVLFVALLEPIRYDAGRRENTAPLGCVLWTAPHCRAPAWLHAHQPKRCGCTCCG